MTATLTPSAIDNLDTEETESLLKGRIDLTREALLLKLSIKRFNPSRKSEVIVDDTAEKYRCSPESVEGKVRLIRKEQMAAITAAVSAARGVFAAHTLAWDDGGGYRICALRVYDKLKESLGQIERDFNLAADELHEKYEQLKREAESDLGDLLEGIGFPSAEEFRASFAFETNELPITDPKDIRLSHISQEQIDSIRNGIAAKLEARVEGAQLELVERLQSVVANAAEQCDKENPRIYDSLIGNVQKICELVPSMNLSGNADIDRLAERANTLLGAYTAQELREDGEKRSGASLLAKDILNDLRNFRTYE